MVRKIVGVNEPGPSRKIRVAICKYPPSNPCRIIRKEGGSKPISMREVLFNTKCIVLTWKNEVII